MVSNRQLTYPRNHLMMYLLFYGLVPGTVNFKEVYPVYIYVATMNDYIVSEIP